MDAASITETLNIHINPINDAPEPDGYKAPLPDGLENTTYTINASDLTSYFTDVEGDTISLTAGSLSLDNTDVGELLDNGDGTFSFNPAENFAGTVDLSFSVNDGNSGTSTGSYSFNILPVNDPPVRIDDSGFDFNVTFNIDEDAAAQSLGLTGIEYGPGGGSDEQSQTLSYAITAVPDPSAGTLLLADGVTPVNLGQSISLTDLHGLQFRPAADANGDTSFSFSVTDSGTTDTGSGSGGFSAPISDLELIQREITLRSDLSGDGTTGVTINSKLSSTTAGAAITTHAYDSSAGLLLSDNSALPTNSPAGLTAGYHKLLLNADGTAGFSIPDGESFSSVLINSNTGAATLSTAINPPPATTNTVTGFSLYTTEPAANAGEPNTVRLYSFSVDGQLTGNPTTLTENELTKAKIATRSDFNGNNTTGVLIDQKLTDNNTATSGSLNLHVYNTQDNQLLLTDFTALAAGSDLATAPNGALTPRCSQQLTATPLPSITTNPSLLLSLSIPTATSPTTSPIPMALSSSSKTTTPAKSQKSPSLKTAPKQLNLFSPIGRSRSSNLRLAPTLMAMASKPSSSKTNCLTAKATMHGA